MWGDNTFTNEGGGYFNTTDGSSPATNAKKGPKRAQNVVPVMMKHLIDSPEDLQIWGTDVQIVTVVAIVRMIESSTTKITYDIEDETGTMTAHHWMEANKAPQGPEIVVNTYVRVYGALREQNQKKHLLVMKIYPITDLNELTLHLLETIYVNLKAEKLASHENTNNVQPELQNASEDMSASRAGFGGMTNDQKLIFEIIQSQNEETNGIERKDIKEKVPAQTRPKVDTILEFLASEGHIYTTLTDNHFKTT